MAAAAARIRRIGCIRIRRKFLLDKMLLRLIQSTRRLENGSGRPRGSDAGRPRTGDREEIDMPEAAYSTRAAGVQAGGSGFRLTVPGADRQGSLAMEDRPDGPRSLCERYRPRSLAEVVGQGEAVWRLLSFAEAPHPAAFLFHGDTGTGKTSAALGLAHELGCDPYWGVHRIASGEMDAEAVATALRSLRFAAPGSGWKVIVADEADAMSAKARQVWLSALEDIPDRSVIVFTTNNPGRFEPRFLDRCERVRFASDPGELAPAARELAGRIWAAEGLAGPVPDLSGLSELVVDGAISFRRVVRAIESHARGGSPAGPQQQAAAPADSPRRRAAIKAAATRRANRLGITA
jgi:hypothetical protein